MKQGFTFLEVLIALMVSVILIGAVGSALLTALHAEQTADHLQQMELFAAALACQAALGVETTGGVASANQPWIVSSENLTSESGDEWRLWEIAPVERPSLTTTIALRK